MKILVVVIISLFFCAASITSSYSASFDCTKTKSKIEKLICSDQNLSELDEELNDAYQKQLTSIKNIGLSPLSLIKDQRAWVKLIRNTCSDLSCLANVYPQRIKDIQSFSSVDHVDITGNSNVENPHVNDYLTLACDYENSKTSEIESIHISQTLEGKSLHYVDSFKRTDKKPQHMRFDVSSGGSASCNFPSGKSVKVKVGEGIASAYGECGADPEIFASIWIDQKKVISRRWFAGHCYDIFRQPLFSFSVSNGKASVCDTIQSLNPNGEATKSTRNCTSINDIEKLPKDTIEYPLPGIKTSPLGSIEIISGKSPICQSITPNRDNSSFSGFAHYPQRETKIALPEVFEGSSESIYDFDNDGKLDRVFTVGLESHYMQGNAIIVQFGKSTKKLEVDQGSILGENSMIAACQLGSTKYRIEDCPPLRGQKADESGFEMKGPGEQPVYFRARYSGLYPFRYENSNYIGVESYSQDTMNYIAVIKPLPNRKFEQTCLIREVLENY